VDDLSIPGKSRDFSLRYRVQTGFGTFTSSNPMGTGGSFPEESGRGVKLTTHLRLVPRPRMCGAIPAPRIRLHGVVHS
jgi:hypothetical protein